MKNQCSAMNQEAGREFNCSSDAVVRRGRFCYCSQHAVQRGIALPNVEVIDVVTDKPWPGIPELVYETETLDMMTGKPWQRTH